MGTFRGIDPTNSAVKWEKSADKRVWTFVVGTGWMETSGGPTAYIPLRKKDEPTTALDMTVEAVVLDLIEELKNEFNIATLFITHNLGVVARVSDQMCVMYAGDQVEMGAVQFLGLDATQQISDRDTKLIREMQMVFQNPDATLNPCYTVGWQIARPIRRFKTVPKQQVKAEVLRLLHAVRLGASYHDRLPRQLSGGEKQRVGIARALASRPDLIICDEPVSALDVSVQAAVINLLLEIQQVFGASMIFIAHDLSVVRYFSDQIAVMYLGQIVEIGPAEAIYAPPYHPYTEALLSAVPIPDPDARQKGIRLAGNVPSALNPPSGCRFHTRCPRRHMLPDNGSICTHRVPPWRGTVQGHRILCHIPMARLMTVNPVVHDTIR